MRFTRLGKDAGPLQPFRGGGGRQESRGNALKGTSGCTEGLHGALESTRVRESAHLVALQTCVDAWRNPQPLHARGCLDRRPVSPDRAILSAAGLSFARGPDTRAREPRWVTAGAPAWW